MEIIVAIISFTLGACIGSFINMGIFRTALDYGLIKKKKSLLGKKRSFCDFCESPLPWWVNIPIISYLFLGGKSKCCSKKLPLSYLIVEILTGLSFLFVSSSYFDTSLISGIQVLYGWVLMSLLIFLTFFDIKYMILPDFATFSLIALAFVGVLFDEVSIIPYLVASIGSFLFLGFLNLITKGKGMGLGDVKFAIFMGLLLGWQRVLVAFYIAFISGAIWGLLMMLIKKIDKKKQIPFGPFLILGTVVALFFGGEILGFVNSYILR